MGCGSGDETSRTEPTEATDQARLGAAGHAESNVAIGSDNDVLETARIEKYIDSIYPRSDVRHSFRTVLGDDIDCIDFYAQPSVKSALQRGLPVSDRLPPNLPTFPSLPNLLTDVAFDGKTDENGARRECPEGTVPYVRQSIARIKRAGGLDAFLSRRSRQPGPSPVSPGTGSPGPDTSGFDHVVRTQNVTNGGGLSIFSVYNPWVYCPFQSTGGCACGGYNQPFCDHSLMEVWSYTGTCIRGSQGAACPSGTSPVQSAEVGWIEDYGTYVDTYTHIFVYATGDGYYQTGCYSSEQGTTQASSNPPCSFTALPGAMYAPNMVIATGTWQTPMSNPPPEMAVLTFNPGSGGVWYIAINGNWIGMLGGSYSGQMLTTAATYQTGGEIYDNEETQNPPVYDNTCMGACYNPATSGGGFEVSAYAYDNYYLTPAASAALCPGVYNGNGWCWVPVTTTPASTGAESSHFGFSTTLPAGTTSSGNWWPYFYLGGGR